jgi:NAD(P)H-dependent FMN reductase
MDVTRVLLLCGSLRSGSTNAAVLRTVADLAPSEICAITYDGMATLPYFNPDDDAEGATVHPAVRAFRELLQAADAVLICTPEYAGALPGAFKNLLEWTVGDASTYRKPVAWINASSPAAPTGGADAHASLERVLGYVGADVVQAAVRRLPLARSDVGKDGLIHDPAVRGELQAALGELVAHARRSTAPGDAS